MVQIKISESSNYSFKKTLVKLFKEALIWGLPQLANFLIVANPDFASMTIGALASIGARTLVDYLKHR